MSMSTEADIVERLLDKHFFSDGMMAARSEADADLIDKYRAERRDAAAEITKLRAERDATARDMRERCKAAVMYRAEVWKNAVEVDVHSPCGQALWEECEDIANHIGAFPLLATEGTSHE